MQKTLLKESWVGIFRRRGLWSSTPSEQEVLKAGNVEEKAKRKGLSHEKPKLNSHGSRLPHHCRQLSSTTAALKHWEQAKTAGSSGSFWVLSPAEASQLITLHLDVGLENPSKEATQHITQS